MWSLAQARTTGERLSRARMAARITQQDLAAILQAVGVRRSQAEISRLERGTASMLEYTRPRLMTAIAEATGASPLWLLYGVTHLGTVRQAPILAEHVQVRKASTASQVASRGPLGSVGAWEWDCVQHRAHFSPETDELFDLETVGRPLLIEDVLNHIHPDDQDLLEFTISEYCDRAIPFVLTARLQLPSGESRWFLSQAAPVATDDGTPVRMVGLVQEIADGAPQVCAVT
jgi:transcriptional regulator with XRE-family HTH domain